MPNFGPYGNAQTIANLARDAEEAGWDGFFMWDHLAGMGPTDMVDPWIAMTAIATQTNHIRFGALVTPLPRRRPWKVARETVLLGRLSEGRLIFGVGLGVGPDEWDNLGNDINKAIIPGLQGGPHLATISGIAVAAEEASQPAFQAYAKQIRNNADTLAAGLMSEGIKLMGNGTENHLMVVDFTNFSDGLGTQVAYALDVAGIDANRNAVPNEPCSPFYPSGLRVGTPLVTTRGMKEAEMKQTAGWIARVVNHVKDTTLPEDRKQRAAFIKAFKEEIVSDSVLLEVSREVKEVASQFPLFQA